MGSKSVITQFRRLSALVMNNVLSPRPLLDSLLVGRFTSYNRLQSCATRPSLGLATCRTQPLDHNAGFLITGYEKSTT